MRCGISLLLFMRHTRARVIAVIISRVLPGKWRGNFLSFDIFWDSNFSGHRARANSHGLSVTEMFFSFVIFPRFGLL